MRHCPKALLTQRLLHVVPVLQLYSPLPQECYTYQAKGPQMYHIRSHSEALAIPNFNHLGQRWTSLISCSVDQGAKELSVRSGSFKTTSASLFKRTLYQCGCYMARSHGLSKTVAPSGPAELEDCLKRKKGY